MTTLSIDLETYSPVDLKKSGMYKYIESKDFQILIFAYSVDEHNSQVPKTKVMSVDLASGGKIPMYIIDLIQDPKCTKIAHNAQFERICLSKFLGVKLDPQEWECTMARSAMAGWPLSLDQAAKAMKLEELKDFRGKGLIRYFSSPGKIKKRNLPQDDKDKWQQFREYCETDVRVENAIRKRVSDYKVTDREKEIYCLDQKINDTGVLVDPELIEEAISIMDEMEEKLIKRATEFTGLKNPNSLVQIKKWIENEAGIEVPNLTKQMMPEVIQRFPDGEINELLKIRMELSKTSVKKYNAMISCVCKDGRIRGLLQYYGANRTGRWAGRLVQVQNLASNTVVDLDYARELVRNHDTEMLEMCYGSIPNILSQLIRTAFIAPAGKKLIRKRLLSD
jgi:DNA polymerase